MINQNPEHLARDNIDRQLRAAGWLVQKHGEHNIAAGRGVAVCEFPMLAGYGLADYLLFVDKKVVGLIEAKKEGITLTGVEVQTERYSLGLPPDIPAPRKPLPFLYQSTGVETYFTNALEPEAQAREIFSFHRPETLSAWMDLHALNASAYSTISDQTGSYHHSETVKARVQDMPPLTPTGMRDCQIEAITNLERSLAEGRRRSLVQMQTGSGKTYTAIAQSYRLIKFARARRVLFLVDRSNLGKQALGEFQQFVTPDDGRKFTELYNVQWLRSNKIDPAAKVVITTIQRLYSILQGEPEFDQSLEESPGAGGLSDLIKDPLPVVYNPSIPVEEFDFVFIDECHRSIYNLWRQVLEYFDAQLIGLTATPSKQTLGFFHQNLVMEYGHAQAVVDKVNVDYDVYRIRTEVTEQGIEVEAKTWVTFRDRRTRRKRWAATEEDAHYRPAQIDRAITVPDQIRTVIRAFRDNMLPECFPERTHVPKTLIFAKDDNHAEEIVRIVREEFAKSNEFCEKITYNTGTVRVVDPETGNVTYRTTNITAEHLLSSFKNSYNPRIAVTVDMIATGTDIKPLEIVFFMRDVRSGNYFEQMKGRGCRVLTSTEFRNVTPDAQEKLRYVIVDAVGVTEHDFADSPPLERQPTVPLKTLLGAAANGNSSEDVVSTLGSRLARLDRVMAPGVRSQIVEILGGPLVDVVRDLVDAVDPDRIEVMAQAETGITDEDSPELEQARRQIAVRLREKAIEPLFDAGLRRLLLLAQEESEMIVHTDGTDTLLGAGASAEATERARSTISSFREYLEENRDEITAIQMLYTRRRGLSPTLRDLKGLVDRIQAPPRNWTPERLWQAYEMLERARVRGRGGKVATDLVSLVRFALEQETVLAPFQESVDDRFTAWLTTQRAAGATFTPEQLSWLTMMKDHIAASMQMERDDFDLSPFSGEGGLGRAYAVFGESLWSVMAELNEVLVA